MVHLIFVYAAKKTWRDFNTFWREEIKLSAFKAAESRSRGVLKNKPDIIHSVY